MSPFAGTALPLTSGTVTLREIIPEAITWISPYDGQADAVSRALTAQIGAAFPAPNRSTGSAAARAIWAGPDQALILGPKLDPIPGAAQADQTGAWACCALEGDDARAVLARLTPIDLRPDMFEIGHAARTLLGHMTCALLRSDATRYEVMIFRSMAGSAAHEIARAMRQVAARADL